MWNSPGNIKRACQGPRKCPKVARNPHEGLRNKASSCAPHAVASGLWSFPWRHNEVEGVPLPQSFSKHMLSGALSRALKDPERAWILPRPLRSSQPRVGETIHQPRRTGSGAGYWGFRRAGGFRTRPKVSSFPTRPKSLFHEGTRETFLKTGILLCPHCIIAG